MIYEPREDSYLLESQVKKYAFGDCLDIGTGSGILAKAVAEKKNVKSVLAIDVNPEAVQSAKVNNSHQKIRFKKQDFFEMKQRKFDTIIFNPPYLPEDSRIKDRAVDGGPKGYELIENFLSKAEGYLYDKGIILLLFSSFTKKERIDDILKKYLFSYKQVSHLKLDFETLYVYNIQKSSFLVELRRKGISSLKLFAKGHRGLIYTGSYKGKQVSIKKLRDDSKARKAIEREIEFLRGHSILDFIPEIILSGKDYFVYNFIDGITMPEFVRQSTKQKIKAVIIRLLDYMHKLDRFGYSKQEMHNPYKHILLVGEKPYLLDFERCRKSNKPKNVTQFCQYLISKNFSSLLAKKNLVFEKGTVISLCKDYKRNKAAFKEIIKYLRNI